MFKALIAISLVHLFCHSAVCMPEGWTSRANVVEAGTTLLESVKMLQDEIQTVEGPTELIENWSEFSVQLKKFTDNVEVGASYEHALMQFGHVTQFMYQARSLMYKYKACCYLPEVRHKYNRVRLGFRHLDRHLNNETP